MDIKKKLLEITSLCADYCRTLENCREMELDEFLNTMLSTLPRIYLEFNDLRPTDLTSLQPENEYFSSYVDEDYYDSIRRNVEMLLGPSDTFLETFEEDMKYSDTPIASSISECLADIFQPLFNFISIVKDSEGDASEEAYIDCWDNFASYWSQTLCNVLRALNHIKYN